MPRQLPDHFGALSSVPTLQPVAHVGGVAVTVATQGNYAYLGLSHELVVLDLLDRTRPRQVANVPVPTTDIVLIDQFAYVVGRNGLHIVDVADPAAPRQLGHWQTDATLSHIVVVGDFAYITSYSDFYVVNIANREEPQVIGQRKFDAWLGALAAAHGYIYAISDRGFHVIDVTVPTLPIALYLLETERETHGSITIQGNDAYFGGETLLQHVNLSSPAIPQHAPSIPIPTWLGDVTISDGIAYLATGFSGLQSWDIRDGRAPIRLDTFTTAGFAMSLAINDGYLYLVDSDEGLQIVDVTDPAHLTPVGAVSTLGITYQVAGNDTFAYVAGGFNGGLHLVELGVVGTPARITAHLQNEDVHDVELVEERLYVLSRNRLTVYATDDDIKPHAIGTYAVADGVSLRIDDQFAFLSNRKGDVLVLDISVPATIDLVGQYPALGHVGAMAIADGYGYLPHPQPGLRIFSIGNGGTLEPIGQVATVATVKQVVVDGRYAYLALGRHGLAIVDISNPAAPQQVGSYRAEGSVDAIVLHGRYAFVAVADVGLQLLDLINVQLPTAVTQYPTLDRVSALMLADRYLYVADCFAGLQIYRIDEPSSAIATGFGFVPLLYPSAASHGYQRLLNPWLTESISPWQLTPVRQ
ncbi:MAG: hypothetical protein KDE53_03860 [Caldilineaceae bacterium]|nr:hypothetical protein [Caldilineaceae bacterium]